MDNGASKRTPLLGTMDYKGTLDGNSLEIEIPQKNGKIKKVSFGIYDRKWQQIIGSIAPGGPLLASPDFPLASGQRYARM